MYSMDCRSMNLKLNYSSLSIELHRKLYAIRFTRYIGAATLTVKRTQRSLCLCFVKDSFNGFARGSAATYIRKGPSRVLLLISVRAMQIVTGDERVYKKCGVSGLTCTSSFFRVNYSL